MIQSMHERVLAWMLWRRYGRGGLMEKFNRGEVAIILTTNMPTEPQHARNSIEVRYRGLTVARTYEHPTSSEAYEEAIRYLVELFDAYRRQVVD